MLKRRRLLMEDEDTAENFWPSFTDLTSTITLVLFVLVLLAYVQNLIHAQTLSRAETRLERTLAQLESSRRELARTVASVEAGRSQLRLSEQKVGEQQLVIAESNRQLDELRAGLQSIAVLRLDVLRTVKDALEAGLERSKPSGGTLVFIGDNGNIVINESLLFEFDSHAVKKSGRELLMTLSRVFLKVLDDPAVRDSIDVIVVQGHSDERGGTEYNRELSAKRANAVLAHVFETNPRLESEYGSYFAASAYSEFRPVDRAQTEAAYQLNRRIELSIVVRDSSVRALIDRYMQNDLTTP